MIRLLALYISIVLSVFSPTFVSAAPQNIESDPGTVLAILSILRAHGQASQDAYCYACRWAGQLGNRELPSDVARDFYQVDPEFIDFYRHVLAELVKLNPFLLISLFWLRLHLQFEHSIEIQN